ncbi:MAG: RIP metalloprotease RseP [Cyclobacteriaceae bacterium]|nr:RIP metalloprotease RseP [Cyclobacteriaceae bacterium]
MEGIIMAAQIILSLSILVGVHEAGHMFAAKFFGMRVEQFSIGFPPRIFGVKYGETEYTIGAIPLGGFVKISGMIDESMDLEAMKEEPKEWEFRSKPAWQRLIVMLGGIIVNVFTGVIIFIALTYSYGEQYFPKEEIAKYGIVAEEIGQKIGLQTGDKIVNISGNDYKRFSDLFGSEALLGDNAYYTVLRNDQEIRVDIPADLIEELSDKKKVGKFIEPRYPFEVGTISPGSEADKVGLQPGDKIVAVGGTHVQFFDQFEEEKKKHTNQSVDLSVLRGNEELTLTVNLDESAMVGFQAKPLLKLKSEEYSLAQSIGMGSKEAFTTVWVNIKGLGRVISGDIDPRKSLLGPIGIARIFGGTWNWERFWNLTGMLSMILAFMNLLPIPALDGGHVMFLMYEIVSGRKPSDKFLENAQKVGMVVLLALMVFVFGNDIFNLFR